MKVPKSSANRLGYPRRTRWVALAFLLLSPGLAGAQESFDAANRLYENGKFSGARTAYEHLVEAGPWSANLFYNLGNAEWKLGQAGRAALDYERALALQPGHPEARANLDFVRTQTGAKTIARAWWEEALAALPADAAAVLAALCGWAVLFCFAARLLRRSPSAVPAAGLVIALLVGAYAAGALWMAARDSGKAAIVAKSSPARVAPADAAPIADVLPAGSEVLAPEVRGPWTYCTLPSGLRAWVATNAVERVALAHQ